MRLSRVLWVVGGGLGFGALALPVGCFSFEDDCQRSARCPPSETTTSSGSGGEGGTVNIACIPSQAGGPVASDCGVFVSASGLDMNDGSMGSPVATINKALQVASAGSKRVYVCAEAFTEAIQVPAGFALYGGLDCSAGWAYAGATKKTSITPAADAAAQSQVAVRLSAGGGVTHIEDLSIKAADAMLPGGSSVGVLVEAVSVELIGCDVTAGNATAGGKGETPTGSVGPEDPADSTIRGLNGTKACNGTTEMGNVGGGVQPNPLCTSSVGGSGGTGRETSGEDGTDGQPEATLGKHGVGQPATGSWSCGAVGNGQAGDNGMDGASGTGAEGASALGTISLSGYTGAPGNAGQPGTPGQGGGGGGATKGKAGCNGASGGGGGAGGCGGAGGLGGQGGGGSIALISLNATLSFQNVTLTAAKGGDAGEGSEGQAGGIGGFGGTGGLGSGTSAACTGGQGGQGGFGGRGGGGRGGPSLGIAFAGSAPPAEGVTIMVGEPGAGGPGMDTGAGEVGVASPTLELPQGG